MANYSSTDGTQDYTPPQSDAHTLPTTEAEAWQHLAQALVRLVLDTPGELEAINETIAECKKAEAA